MTRKPTPRRAPDGVRPFRARWPLAAASCAGRRLAPTWPVAAIAVVAISAASSHLEYRLNVWKWRTGSEPDGFVRIAEHVGPPLLTTLVLALWIFQGPIRRIAAAHRQRASGGERWWRDAAWPATGVERRIARGVRSTMATPLAVALAALACFASVGHMLTWGMVGSAAPWIEFAVTPFSIVVQALAAAWLTVVLLPRLGRGRLVVAWPVFPQRTGGPCTFHVGTSPGGARIDGVRIFLRCVAEVRVRDWPWTRRPRLRWVAEARLPLGTHVGPESHVRAGFDVPAGLRETDLSGAPPVHWEVLVLGTVGGAEYADRVMVPVYAP